MPSSTTSPTSKPQARCWSIEIDSSCPAVRRLQIAIPVRPCPLRRLLAEPEPAKYSNSQHKGNGPIWAVGQTHSMWRSGSRQRERNARCTRGPSQQAHCNPAREGFVRTTARLPCVGRERTRMRGVQQRASWSAQVVGTARCCLEGLPHRRRHRASPTRRNRERLQRVARAHGRPHRHVRAVRRRPPSKRRSQSGQISTENFR